MDWSSEKNSLKNLIKMRDRVNGMILEKKIEYLSGFLGGEDFVRKHRGSINEIVKIERVKDDNWFNFYFYSSSGFENIGVNLEEEICEGTFRRTDIRNSFISDLLDRRDAREIIDLLEK
jgi:hypothetical protein